jgi:Mn2+/Fe2+ NRAMP family transporter
LKLFKKLGPGLLYAGAAVGVSHLVQSTRAGADFGYGLLWAIVIANLLKYPFFEFGPRYATATGKSLIRGYAELGKAALVLFFLITLAGMFVIIAAITVVTAGLAEHLTHIQLGFKTWSAIVLLGCTLLLVLGRFSLLDSIMKVIIVVLSLTTIVAFTTAFFSEIPSSEALKVSFDFGKKSHLLFLIALMGWMPAPLDISVWHSEWTLAKKLSLKENISLKESLMDFKIGYWGTAFLAILFLGLGAEVMYATGQQLNAESSAGFAGALIDVYTSTLGSWAYPIIVIAAFTTMFSTCLTCLDAYPRVMLPTVKLLFPAAVKDLKQKHAYFFWIVLTASIALFIIVFFASGLKQIVDFATTLSFLAAPVLAVMNHKVINSNTVPKEAKPSGFLNTISVIGIAYLIFFAFYYLWVWY